MRYDYKYEVHDDEGVLRIFDDRSTADEFAMLRNFQVVVRRTPRPEKPKVDLSEFEPAPF